MTYKATYYVGKTPKETRYYGSVIEAALYFEKHPGEFDGMSAALQKVQDMRQGKEGGKDCNRCLRYDPVDGICFNEKSDYFESAMRGYDCCDEWEELGELEP